MEAQTLTRHVKLPPLLSGTCDVYYQHLPINEAWICRLLFVCLFSVFVWLRISPARIKLAASNFARRFIGIQGRESPILGNFAPPEAQNRTNRRAAGGRRIGMCG